MYKIIFEKKAEKQFFKLSRDVQERLTKAIDEKLAVNPKEHLIHLSGDKAGFYKFRVGDYRLLCSKDDDKFIILIVKVKHRRDVYKR
jgi:mRNA interferase RelE/StbE